MQISRTVEKIRDFVVILLSALRKRAHISVSVNEDSAEMEKCVLVSKHKHFYSTHM